MSTPRISGNSITYEAPIVLYANSPERTHLNPRHTMIIAGSANRSYFASTNLTYDEFNPDVGLVIDLPGDPSANPSPPLIAVAPSISDIAVVSKTVVYDSAGKPSVTVVFKINNSSGGELKAINARVSR
jgi:PBP1b-binding outer membrane lipoprotein LpoB